MSNINSEKIPAEFLGAYWLLLLKYYYTSHND